MREVLPSAIGIKASGGIKTLDFALDLIKAGADRVGTSSAKALMEAWRKANL
jgi:deoxyribose-phosphate aldolase